MAISLIDTISTDKLKQLISESHSFYQVAKGIGYSQIYSIKTIAKIKSRCNTEQIDYSHLREDRQLETLICTECGKEQPYNNFYTYNGKVHHICISCKKTQQNDYYHKNIQDLNNYKASCHCAKCGESRFYLLDFHHKDPQEKDFGIAQRANTKLLTLMPEIQKCVVLYSNCHREFHYLQQLNSDFTLNHYLAG